LILLVLACTAIARQAAQFLATLFAAFLLCAFNVGATIYRFQFLLDQVGLVPQWVAL
jgi:hypothetical protein